ncbi:MAG: 50S ribosomal protein L6 [Candidatus Micrarchaeota archaeon]|nr:50S ribosomal protein L6 [Candidatus Micrarchaeota archaeon]
MIEIPLPEGVKAEVKGSSIAISGKLGSNSRKFNDALISIKAESGKIVLDHVKDKKLEHKARNAETALAKELNNDMKGVTQYFEFKMKSIHAHFPITVEAKGQVININNIIGERVPRTASIVGATKVEVKGQNVRLYGTSLDEVSQTAANVRKACRMRNKDTRVFQDGLYFEV